MSDTRTFKVSGIHCEGCEERIGRALSSMPGIQSVSASHTSQEVLVKFDSTSMKAQDIDERLEDIGFPVTS